MTDPMDVEKALRLLNEAAALQYRSALQYALAAGTVSGLAYLGLVERYWQYAETEFLDARRIVEKIVALGGEPTTDVAPVRYNADPLTAARILIDSEEEVIAKLHEVIPPTGQEPRSEALEHFVEHLISRKQEQVDQLLRALGKSEE